MNPDSDVSHSKALPAQQQYTQPPAKASPFLKDSLDASRRKLRIFVGIGLSLGIFDLLYFIWIVGEALLESGEAGGYILSFGLLYGWAIAAPIGLVISFMTYRRLSIFTDIRTRSGINNYEPIEKTALLSIVFCCMPFICIAAIMLFAIITSLFSALFGKS